MTKIDIKAKVLGGPLSSALGSAIGEPAFLYPEKKRLFLKFDRTSELRYTDDTAMAIGLAESILKVGVIDQYQLGETFCGNFFREPWRGYARKPGGGDQSEAVRILGINRVTVWNRMKKYGVDLKKVLMH